MRFNKDTIFVIGYPKSGNTWLARLVADALDSEMIGGRNVVDEADKKQGYNGRYVVYKAHCFKESEHKQLEDKCIIFYIVRDFRDVLISGFFFNNRESNENRYTKKNHPAFKSRFLYRSYFRRQIKRMIKKWQGNEIVSLMNNIKILLGIINELVFLNEKPVGNTNENWSEHVNRWIGKPNVHVVRYEDLLADTFTTIKNLFCNAEIHFSDQRLVEVIQRQSFEVRKKGFVEKGDKVNVKFMRKGVAGDWKRFLDDDLLQRIKHAHGETMNRLGYEI